MSTYRVFLGAPTINEIAADRFSYHWRTVSSSQSSDTISPDAVHEREEAGMDQSVWANSSKAPTGDFLSDGFSTRWLDDASRRISLIYQNVIFKDDDEDRTEGEGSEGLEEDEESVLRQIDDDSQNQTTVITWPPTLEKQRAGEASRANPDLPSFLNITTSSENQSSSEEESFFSQSQSQTQSQSVSYSELSSIARFPTFHFSLHSITSLSALSKKGFVGSTSKVSLIVGVLEVEGPERVKIKNGKDKGKEVALIRMIVGDEGGTIAKLTAWREIAEIWGGKGGPMVKRGDIVLIENVTVNFDPKASPTITASPFLKSSLTICYRTMPYTREDNRMRPDLRLGRSDAAVRKVAEVVGWFERLAGLELVLGT